MPSVQSNDSAPAERKVAVHVELLSLAQRQNGVFSVEQASSIGVTRAKLRTLVRHGVIVLDVPGVYRVAGAARSWRQQLWVATLWLPGSLVSHRSAARLWGLRGFDSAPVEVLVERWTRRHRPPDVIVHETKDLVGADIHEVDGLRCTSLVRTLVDLPAVVRDGRAGDALDHAVRRDRTTLQRVATRHREVARRGRNGTVRLRDLLAARLDGNLVDSAFERLVLDLVARAGLPTPRSQYEVRDGAFAAYLDLAWPAHRLAVECDGYEHHSSLAAFQHDRRRRRELVRLGWTVIEFTWQEAAKRPALVARTIAEHLERLSLRDMA